ncbi:PIN domain-containing protein [Ramlibacter sp. GTP1]|uniref:PIN domain-containing protein n=1 Tax=Ramlibacter albus TaxID=2079448 RepID=A0A923MDL8_9BURK|nr:PIN domain-containing protein [Ramlibacter albus]
MTKPTPAARFFLDTNVLLYLFSGETGKADRAEALLLERPTISVQVLNEFTSVALRKLSMGWDEVDESLAAIKASCAMESLTEETHETGCRLAQRYSLNVYDAMIAASALLAGCNVLYSEDMQHGLLLEKRLRIVDPFKP